MWLEGDGSSRILAATCCPGGDEAVWATPDVLTRTGQSPQLSQKGLQRAPARHTQRPPPASCTHRSAPGGSRGLARVSYGQAQPPLQRTQRPGLRYKEWQSALSLIYDVRGRRLDGGRLQGLLSIPFPISGLPPLAAWMGLIFDGSRWRVRVCENRVGYIACLNCSCRIPAWNSPLKTLKLP